VRFLPRLFQARNILIAIAAMTGLSQQKARPCYQGRALSFVLCADQPRVRERIMKLS
jgi:hypothetical protein